jgi:hypothetical protein
MYHEKKNENLFNEDEDEVKESTQNKLSKKDEISEIKLVDKKPSNSTFKNKKKFFKNGNLMDWNGFAN